MRRFFVSPCDEPDGSRTWDVMEREPNRDESTAVANFSSRQRARTTAAEYNEAHSRGGASSDPVWLTSDLVLRGVHNVTIGRSEGGNS